MWHDFKQRNVIAGLILLFSGWMGLAGATRAQAFVYGVMPQAFPLVASYSLLLFETNVRSASVLGIVGAGGVGFLLGKYMALFQYQHLTGALVLIVLAVTGLGGLLYGYLDPRVRVRSG